LLIIIMKTSPLNHIMMPAYYAIIFLAAVVVTDFSMDTAAAETSSAARSPPSKSKTLLSKPKLNPRAIYPTVVGITHPETGESLHGIVGQRERNLASRRLLINQDDAAKRVQDAVTTANQAVENGETSGVALPLNYVLQPISYGEAKTTRCRQRSKRLD
jgi:hypothetical protein